MGVEIIVTQKVVIETIRVDAGVRYWEDAIVDGQVDEQGSLIPCRYGNSWKPVIAVSTGQILNWRKGTVADIHYKVCDDGTYTAHDAETKTILKMDGYVPKFMSPGGAGYGDYIIMDVDADGFIRNWKIDFDEFPQEQL